MATRTATTTTWAVPGDATDLDFRARIASIRGKFLAGQQIYLSDIEQIRYMIGVLMTHTHDAQEYAAIYDYGNTGSTAGPYNRTTSSVLYAKDTTITVSDLSNTATGWAVGSPILASHHIMLKTNATYVKSHVHQIMDT